MPTSPSSMIEAAAKPVSREIWAFQFSTGSISRYSSSHRPSCDVDLLGRHRQGDPTALGLLGDPQLTHRLEQGQRGPGGRTVDLTLDALVVQPLP